MSACEVVDADGKPCQGTDIQLHHWAPKCLFGDEAELWPKSYLCRDHHNMWHTGITDQMWCLLWDIGFDGERIREAVSRFLLRAEEPAEDLERSMQALRDKS
jgi:hypothetical protein